MLRHVSCMYGCIAVLYYTPISAVQYTRYTSPLCVQGLKGQLTREFKQSFALLVDKNAPRPSDALSDID